MKLSLGYSHEQVLDMYLNSIYYGNGYWGVVAAARGYFGISPRRLSWGEASLLAGLPQAPSAYDPVHHLRLARLRQRHVLDQLVANGYLTSAAADAAFREPMPLRSGGGRRSSSVETHSLSAGPDQLHGVRNVVSTSSRDSP